MTTEQETFFSFKTLCNGTYTDTHTSPTRCVLVARSYKHWQVVEYLEAREGRCQEEGHQMEEEEDGGEEEELEGGKL